jgi:MFS family permease
MIEGSAAAGASTEAAWPRPAYAWYVCWVMMIAYTFAILDRVAMGFLVAPIKESLALSDTQIGLLQGFAFAIFYSLFGLPMGFLVDRWRRASMLSLAIGAWSIATMAGGLARSFGGLFAARVGVGAGESALLPGATSMIGDYFPPDKRPNAMSVFMLGGGLGGGMAPLFVAGAIVAARQLRALFPALSGHLHEWQLVFMVLGAPGLIMALVIILTVREPVRRERMAQTKFSLRTVVEQLAAAKAAYASLMAAGVITGIAIAAQFAWFPSLFTRIHHWSPEKIGLSFALAAVPTNLIGTLAGGWVLTWMAKRGRRDGPILIMAGQALFILFISTSMALSPNPYAAVACYSMLGITGIWSMIGALSGLSQITPNEMRGQVVAVFTLLNGLLAYALGAASVGLLTDHVFTGPTGIRPALALVYLGTGSTGLLALWLGRKAFVRAVDRMQAIATA